MLSSPHQESSSELTVHRAFSFSYFRKVRFLLNITGLQLPLGILDLYFLGFGRKHAILVSI